METIDINILKKILGNIEPDLLLFTLSTCSQWNKIIKYVLYKLEIELLIYMNNKE